VRILLDENLLSRKLKQPLIDAGHEVQNVDDMGWRGTKDTALLALANTTPFDIFITADKNLPYQQNFQNLTLRIVPQFHEYTPRSADPVDYKIDSFTLIA
jgi:predicted nuclease of predicted toxin-antitoxin system